MKIGMLSGRSRELNRLKFGNYAAVWPPNSLQRMD